jgi:hypothetical protein
MKKIILFLLATVSSMSLYAQYNNQNLKVKETGSYTYKNLQLYPVFANQVFLNEHKGLGNYTPLQKALESKKIIVTETSGGSGTVNTLLIENTSSDTIMIMAGEVVKGGKQDRVLGQDMLLPPHSGKKDISVFCVEQGRWSYKGDSQSANQTFQGYSKVSSTAVRKGAIVDKNQGKVWKEVADVTSKSNATTQSGTYTALENSKQYTEECQKYVDYFKKEIGALPNVVGVVACTGNKVIGCDMFATQDMFLRYMENLLTSYSTEAISNGSNTPTGYPVVQEYLNKFLSDESKQETEINKNGTILKSKDKKIHMTTF